LIDGISVLNAATYKPTNARLVLPDDAVLVPRRRRRRYASESDKLVADHCWPFNLYEGSNVNARMQCLRATPSPCKRLQAWKRAYMSSTDPAADKKNLLSQSRHVSVVIMITTAP
jgi:exocyst complex component 8